MNAEKGSGPRKLLPIIYVLDTSRSMKDSPIAALNAAMREMKRVLKEAERRNPQAKIMVGVVTFSAGAEWITGAGVGLEEIDDFEWYDVAASGCTDLGHALELLYDKLSRNDVIRAFDTLGYCRPAIIFISDGAPTDNWRSGFEKAMSNIWFSNALRISMAVGKLAQPGTDAWDVLCEISSGGEESVIEITDIEALSGIIKAVSMSVSKVNSRPVPEGSSNPAKEAKEELENRKESLSGDLTPEQESDTDDEVDKF